MIKVITLIASIFVVTNVHFVRHQENCDLNIPSGNWTAKTINGEEGIYGNTNVVINKNGNDVISISDFSAGYLNALDFGSEHPIDIRLSCDYEIIPLNKSTEFGNLDIIGGNYNSESQILTLEWSLTDNYLKEKSEFQFKN